VSCLRCVKKREERRRATVAVRQRTAVGKCGNCHGSVVEWLEQVWELYDGLKTCVDLEVLGARKNTSSKYVRLITNCLPWLNSLIH